MLYAYLPAGTKLGSLLVWLSSSSLLQHTVWAGIAFWGMRIAWRGARCVAVCVAVCGCGCVWLWLWLWLCLCLAMRVCVCPHMSPHPIPPAPQPCV